MIRFSLLTEVIRMGASSNLKQNVFAIVQNLANKWNI